MPRENRLYAKFTLDFPEHPKIAALTDSAYRTLSELIIYSRRVLADGKVPERVALKYWPAEALHELTQNHPERPSLTLVDGHYVVHDYSEHQTTKADIDAKREAGSKGGRAKAANQHQAGDSGGETGDKGVSKVASPGVAPATNEPEQNGYENVAKTETETETHQKPPAAEPRVDVEALFEQAWKTWPKKTDRKDAKQKFAIALRRFKGREEQLVAAVKLHGEAYALHNEPQFRPGLAVWLNKERWENPLPGTPEAGGPGEADGKPAPTKDPNDWMQRKRRVDPNQEPGAPA
jgi:hypothetical protein